MFSTKITTFIGTFFSVLALSSCISPTGNLQAEVNEFKKEFPNQIQKYDGKNRTMNYAWSGNSAKQALLFVHGSPGSWEGWVHFLRDPELLKNFQLIAIDRPGYGGSGEGKTEVSLAAQAEDLLEVLKVNKSQRPAILIGHSYGGPVIARAAMDHPEKVAGLIFVASSVDPDLESTKWFQYPATWWPFRVLIPAALRVCNEEILPLKAELQKMAPLWKNISAKVVLIQGQKDDLVPPGNLDYLIKNLNQTNVVKIFKIQEMNHFVPWQHPELIFQGIHEINAALRSGD